VRLKIIAQAEDFYVGEGPDGTLYGRFEEEAGATWVPIQGWSVMHSPGAPDKLSYARETASEDSQFLPSSISM